MSKVDAATRAGVGDVVGTSCIPGAPGHSTSSRLGRCKWMCAVLAVLCASVAFGAEPQRISAKPGLIELRLSNAPDGADISWEARQPLTQEYRQYEKGEVLVTHATTGQLVFVSDVIDWENRKREKTTWIVDITSTPPSPGPAPEPQPVPLTGLSADIWKLVQPIEDPVKANKYASAYEVMARAHCRP